jgi:hypothetical protein
MAAVWARWGILLVTAGVLLPASLVAGVFLVTRITFEAINSGPINPARGSFTFLTEMDPSFVLTGPTDGDRPTSLISVQTNFGSYTINDVGVRCEREPRPCIIPAAIGGILNGIGTDHLGDVGIVRGTDDFELGLILQLSRSVRSGLFQYVFADGRIGAGDGHGYRWCAAGICDEWALDELGDTLTLEIEQFTTEISPD